jgi:hypothetical protein
MQDRSGGLALEAVEGSLGAGKSVPSLSSELNLVLELVLGLGLGLG